MINKIFVAIGVIAVLVIVFFLGVMVGVSPTDQEKQEIVYQEKLYKDTKKLSDNYSMLYSLCEEKYQIANDGDYYKASRINGQMDSIIVEIEAILDNYKKITY